nr:SDR family oxidoreductase [uncultured Arsenicibacter sp.]
MSYALVTGAAKGIGKAIAAELAGRHFDLLLIDKAEDELQLVARQLRKEFGIKVELLIQDLSAPDAAKRIFIWTTPFHARLTVVINNAGFGVNGYFSQIPLEEHLELINVNINAVLSICHYFIPVLQQQPKSYLLNVGSTTAYQTVPYVNVYAASKSFVVSFTRGLRHELRHSPVSVTCLSPGSTDTDFVNRARMGESIRKTADKVNMKPEEVARIGVEALFNHKAEVVAGFINKVGTVLPRFFPESFVASVVGNIYEPKD